ncbi:uncharacterized protein Z519_12146 [Cladophialophora bantiana CBS 173.52]|uniref:Lysine-specific metallo-endopeptidase domain-containing protein n=1 Tax=Cladophialophora bantiana (strain ATCC 10958 / CBS 173.52 / CDC B-1940 / NIH 8579) TaxID=1442370 RepID=A0A0D2H1T1_CLAB1|nr:uncharacterized protein Z519_12146 [Cladophialophora bantiana CBS 173.52]KIW87243.1 hypothetical protein Z519_12146 [Cladophialophora bantiana CBS 173.52]
MILSLLLLSFLSFGFSLASLPKVWFPEYFETDPKFQADYPTWKGVVDQAFQDAVTLARVVVLTGNACDPAFLRYFQEQDYGFVQALFARIANVRPPKNTDTPEEVLAMLQNTNPADTLSPVWDKLLLSFLDYPKSPWDIPAGGSCNMQGVNGYLTYDGKAPREENDPARSDYPNVSGYLGMCPKAINWQTCVDLATTENPPDWARKGPGQDFTSGWSCDGLGDRDTGDMRTIGSSLLHEMLHASSLALRQWPELFKSNSVYSQVIDGGGQFGPQIADYKLAGSFPDPYGPFNAAKLAKFAKNSRTGYSQAIQNADNYVWYANSKYWSWKCKRPFGAAASEADNQFNEFRARGPPMYGQWNQPLPDS